MAADEGWKDRLRKVGWLVIAGRTMRDAADRNICYESCVAADGGSEWL